MLIRLFGHEFRLLRRLPSRKNRVYLVKSAAGYAVLKLYRAPHHLRSGLELKVLSRAGRHELAVPRPFAFIEKRALLMEHIPGENLCDLLNSRCQEDYADKLARWFAAFHRSFSRPVGETLLRGDTNLRNFILHPDGTLYGVDFEEATPGDPARDLGQICASILDTEPMFTAEKAALCRRLMARYSDLAGIDRPAQEFMVEIAAALRETAGRRPQQRSYLLEQADLLSQRGLSYFEFPPDRDSS